MKKILLTLIFLGLMTNLSAQECEYAEYYQLVAIAKKEYSQQNYKEASKNFKLAFSKTDFPLGHDLSFALVTANKTNDDMWAGFIAEKLAQGGVPLRYFVKYKKKNWYQKFNYEFENYSNYYRENLNSELREKLISLLNRDSEFNSKYHEWRTKKIEMTLQELIDGATAILMEFQNLTDNYGFQNERLIGYNYVRRKNNIEPYPIGVLIVHIYQRGVLIFKDDIQDIICKGGLHPNYGETLKGIRGFGDSTGIEQEMKTRYAKYRGTE
ncbi:hypothetical protein N7U66_05175 [Lacinutrix neustonica]|uniref:Uncharacterized protein n=1 Tax=Lacinutrix neustonica TaxID=2980107 RepID=A0A9E8MWV8_9FLAO|nr:hypothetical protein [Lacinutrix neustonica]WAC03023.1 hypothetical protein N7U66_05175 [Lacinutrix neustonica]